MINVEAHEAHAIYTLFDGERNNNSFIHTHYFLFFFFFSCLSLSSPSLPSRHSDPGSHIVNSIARSSSHLPTTVRALLFYRDKASFSPFWPFYRRLGSNSDLVDSHLISSVHRTRYLVYSNARCRTYKNVFHTNFLQYAHYYLEHTWYTRIYVRVTRVEQRKMQCLIKLFGTALPIRVRALNS